MEENNKVINDKETVDEDIRLLAIRLEENTNEVWQLSQLQEDMKNQLDNANQEITNLREENERLQNELRA